MSRPTLSPARGRPRAGLAGLALMLAASAAAGADGFDAARQIGPDPVLPPPQQRLLPSVKIAEVIGWAPGQTPDVPAGLKVTAYAV